MTFWQSYTALNQRTRLILGLGVIAWGSIGLLASDKAEKTLGFEATEQDKDALKAALPSIRTVERPSKNS